MKHLFTIIKKELRRFFTDPRMLTALILPGLMIFLLYTIMGDTITSQLDPAHQSYTLRIENEPVGFHFLDEDNYHYDDKDLSKDEYLALVENQKLDLFIEYPSNFLNLLTSGDKPEVTIHYNGASLNSTSLANTYRQFLIEGTAILTVPMVNYASENEMSSSIISSMLPFLLLTFLFTGTMAVAPESIAGEKERGTIASLLITPVKRETVALGKIIALSIVALVSATSSFVGIILSLPKLAGMPGVSLSMYGFGSYFFIFLILISTILIFTVLISLTSAYAKSIKEASGLAMPLMLIITLIGISTMLGKANLQPVAYLIPIYNSVQSLLAIFSLAPLNWLNLLITLLTNLVVTIIGVMLLTKMFESEKMMFRK